MSTSEKPIFSVEELKISFTQYSQGLKRKDIDAIESLSIALYKGKVHALLGESGSGKSLLAHAILDILPPNAILSGDFYYNNRQITRVELRSLRGNKIALVPQSVDYLNPLLKIGNQLALIGGSPEKIGTLLQRYELKESILELYPFQLSGGMARKVMLMMAMSQDAEIIIADEPTPGLDFESVKAVLSDFKKVAEQGCAVLLITHDIGAAIEVADEITIFKGGHKVDHLNVNKQISLEEQLKSCHPFTRALYEAMPIRTFNGGIV